MRKQSRIVVLNDGETFTDAAGCKVYDVDANAITEEIETGLIMSTKDFTTYPILGCVMSFDDEGRMILQ